MQKSKQEAPASKVIQLKKKMSSLAPKTVENIRAVHRHRILALVAALVLLLGLFGFNIYRAASAQVEVQSNIRRSRKEMAVVRAQNLKLKTNVQQLNDPNYLEKYIREKYYFSKPGEIIFSLPGDKGKDVTAK
ncbi:MAG: septum formation initiator family protein [Schleiferilactobacillus perolens]|uniref:FtsB family cell division protein n=1 Tax=Schleiferilactobacillus perolens TaxID=100468 RepID=UPI0039ECF1A5|nr:septum formation initiator family protein [Schleiferilactobacillus harbinensis]MCI1913555.1 septum formation initiator family protein [Schleiferilactobacillus harbinensis]